MSFPDPGGPYAGHYCGAATDTAEMTMIKAGFGVLQTPNLPFQIHISMTPATDDNGGGLTEFSGDTYRPVPIAWVGRSPAMQIYFPEPTVGWWDDNTDVYPYLTDAGGTVLWWWKFENHQAVYPGHSFQIGTPATGSGYLSMEYTEDPNSCPGAHGDSDLFPTGGDYNPYRRIFFFSHPEFYDRAFDGLHGGDTLFFAKMLLSFGSYALGGFYSGRPYSPAPFTVYLYPSPLGSGTMSGTIGFHGVDEALNQVTEYVPYSGGWGDTVTTNTIWEQVTALDVPGFTAQGDYLEIRVPTKWASIPVWYVGATYTSYWDYESGYSGPGQFPPPPVDEMPGYVAMWQGDMVKDYYGNPIPIGSVHPVEAYQRVATTISFSTGGDGAAQMVTGGVSIYVPMTDYVIPDYLVGVVDEVGWYPGFYLLLANSQYQEDDPNDPANVGKSFQYFLLPGSTDKPTPAGTSVTVPELIFFRLH